MADQVIKENEVLLNAIRYKTAGQVRPRLASALPGKVVIGDYSVETEPNTSTWAIRDHRGGLLCEEMDEQTQLDRFWWATTNPSFVGHLVLNPLVSSVTVPTLPTLIDGGLEIWTSASNLTNWTETVSTGSVAREATTIHGGTYSAVLTAQATGGGASLAQISQVLGGTIANYQGKRITFGAWYYGSASGGSALLTINDGVGSTNSGALTLDSTWRYANVSRVINGAATGITVSCHADGGNGINAAVAFDDCYVAVSSASSAIHWCNYNNNVYLAVDGALYKLETTAGASFTLVATMPATITDLISGIDNNLYIFLGDDSPHWYMTTAEVFTETTTAGKTWAVFWMNRIYALDSAGLLSYTATAGGAWTDDADLSDNGVSDNEINNVQLYRDADGSTIIYVATKRGLYAHDITGTQWVETELVLPEHTNSGKGVTRWRDALYVSAGLDVIKYIAGGTATITSAGLAREDGLPSEYNGEIMNLIKGYNEMYALVDSTQTTGTTTSGVYAYDGNSWHNVWVADTTEGTMHAGIVSSAYAYRLWFDHAGTIYYIPLERNLRNPKKLSTYTYAASGTFITPWFDAGWSQAPKIAVRLNTFTSGCSATETVVIKYRVNYSTTAIETTWTTLATLTTNGLVATSFGSSAGLAFKSIQFRFDFVRAAGSPTLSPDLQWATLSFVKQATAFSWGWQFTVDATEEYAGRSPALQLDALKTAAESATLVNFCFRKNEGSTESYYVQIRDIQGQVNTGLDKRGMYNLYVVQM